MPAQFGNERLRTAYRRLGRFPASAPATDCGGPYPAGQDHHSSSVEAGLHPSTRCSLSWRPLPVCKSTLRILCWRLTSSSQEKVAHGTWGSITNDKNSAILAASRFACFGQCPWIRRASLSWRPLARLGQCRGGDCNQHDHFVAWVCWCRRAVVGRRDRGWAYPYENVRTTLERRARDKIRPNGGFAGRCGIIATHSFSKETPIQTRHPRTA
jgi:hypothetical protein